MDRAPPTVIDFTAEHLEMFIVLRTANDTEDKFKKPQHKHRKLAKDGTSFEIIGDESVTGTTQSQAQALIVKPSASVSVTSTAMDFQATRFMEHDLMLLWVP
jgi:hypothetical protein